MFNVDFMAQAKNDPKTWEIRGDNLNYSASILFQITEGMSLVNRLRGRESREDVFVFVMEEQRVHARVFS